MKAKMNKEIKIVRDGNCFYIIQDLWGLDLYHRTRASKNFIENETKVLEECIDNEIKAILLRNGINLQDKSENALKLAFDTLNQKGKKIVITDLFNNNKTFYRSLVVGRNEKSKIVVILEEDRYLQSGVEVKETNL